MIYAEHLVTRFGSASQAFPCPFRVYQCPGALPRTGLDGVLVRQFLPPNLSTTSVSPGSPLISPDPLPCVVV